MTEQIGVALPETGPVLHFSERLDVLAVAAADHLTWMTLKLYSARGV